MNREWVTYALVAVAAGLSLALGLAGETLTDTLSLSQTDLLLSTALIVFVLLAVAVRLVMPAHVPDGDDVALVFPVRWETLFLLGLLVGLLLGAGLLRLMGDGLLAGTIHSYEVSGLILGVLGVVLLAFGRNPIPGAAFGLGFGIAFPSAILLLAPDNNLPLTYGGHLGVMVAAGAIVVLFGHVVRIKIVD